MIGSLLSAPIVAQENLLTNPGFEAPFVAHPGEEPREVAQGWVPWHVPRTDDMPSYQNTQPKYKEAAPDTSRIRSGSNAQQYFSIFEAHDGGVYQRVTGITPGTELRFSVYIYVWSSTFNDPAISEDPGSVFVQVGIDPTGGTNGESSNIVWSTPVEQYDAYREYSVIATAESDAVTVFVRSRVAGFPVQNTQVNLDDAVLAPTTGGDTPEPATDTPEPVEPTDTSEPATDTPAPTDTVEPATDTPEPVEPTDTVEAATNTPLPTNTIAPPTATATPVPPTATLIPASPEDATPTPEGGQVISTPEPVASNTPTTIATPTATEVPSGGSTTPINEEFPGRVIHRVRRGDTVGKLAQLYGSTIQAIIDANGLDSDARIFIDQNLIIPVRIPNPATETPTFTPIPAQPVTEQPANGAGGGGTGGAQNTYVVQPGDTLSSIAQRFNTTIGTLAQLNGIVNANRIFIGQVLQLPVPSSGQSPEAQPTEAPTPEPPQPTVYVVQPGDNLYRIALRFGVSIVRLAEINGITDYNRVFIGQRLTIP